MNFAEQDLKGRRLAHYMWTELEKIANLAQGASPAVSANAQQSGELEGGIQRDPGGEAEASPAHGIVASRIEQISDKKARGTPIIQPPPGFIFAPELQSFVPDEQNPGWMAAEQGMQAVQAKAFYDQGQTDLQQNQAQQEIDTQVSQQADAAAQQAAVGQQQQQAEQAAAVQAPQQQMLDQSKEQAKEQAKATMGGLQTPEAISGVAPALEKKPAKRYSAPKKGVTINVGK